LGWDRVLIYGTGSALVIAGLVALERQGGRWNSRPLARLGDASYSLYLSHVPVIAATGLLWRRLLIVQSAVMRAPVMHVAVLACTFSVAVAGGIASFHLIEAPLLRLLRDRPIRFVLPRPAALAAVRIMRPRHDPR
jgi:exopolysaccharide production protein ExoZ